MLKLCAAVSRKSTDRALSNRTYEPKKDGDLRSALQKLRNSYPGVDADAAPGQGGSFARPAKKAKVVASRSALCGWTGPQDEHAEHLKECQWAQVTCDNNNCDAVVLRKDLPTHEKSCAWSPDLCKTCKGHVPLGPSRVAPIPTNPPFLLTTCLLRALRSALQLL